MYIIKHHLCFPLLTTRESLFCTTLMTPQNLSLAEKYCRVCVCVCVCEILVFQLPLQDIESIPRLRSILICKQV